MEEREILELIELAKRVECVFDLKTIKKVEQKVIEYNDAFFILYFAEINAFADVEKLGKKIIEINNFEYSYRFARNVKGANVKKICEKNLDEFYRFAKDKNDSVMIAKLNKAFNKNCLNLNADNADAQCEM